MSQNVSGEQTFMPGRAIRLFHVAVIGLGCLLAGAGLGWLLRGPAPVAARTEPAPGTMTRLGGYRFVGPLLECDLAAVSSVLALDRLRDTLLDTIHRRKTLGITSHVSVYFRDLNSTAELGIDEAEVFSPASLFKVPVLMAALRAAEKDSTILDRQSVFDVTEANVMHQNIRPRRELTLGQSYTLWAYLEQMIIESDNRATSKVAEFISPADYRRIFQDVGVPVPSLDGGDSDVTVAQYASFFRILYNASYLGPEMSERALALLSRIRFVAGLVAGVPAGIPVAHKFGERRYTGGPTVANQLHDCGVVYFPGRPYLLCLMTRGQDVDALAQTLRELSAQVYQHIQGAVLRQGALAVSSAL